MQLIMCALILKSSQCPDGKMADVLASTLAGATAVAALVNYRIIMYMHAAETSCEFPIDPMGKLRPDGRLTICSLFAGRWCKGLWRHSVNRELPDLLQHSSLCAR